MATTLLPFLADAQKEGFWGFESDEKRKFYGILWKADLTDFSGDTYQSGVDSLLEAFERTSGKRLVPGSQGKAAIKVYTSSGTGLSTPLNLVRAVIAALEQRGFSRDNLSLVDHRQDMLRDAGLLPPLSRVQIMGPYFEGVRVFSLDSGELRSETWFYESPLPLEFTSPMGRSLLRRPIELDPEKARKSFLPSNLLTEVDFWINLPVAGHHPATGLNGALSNASLWNITNNTRFFNSPANAPVAIAEIASIPELQATWALNLISLEAYQFIAGPAFNANYSKSLKELWLSVDPVILDVNLINLINKARQESGFRSLPVLPEFIEYSMQLGLGRGILSETRVFDRTTRPAE